MSSPAKLFDLYIKSSLHVALAVTALACVTVWELHLVHDYLLYAFIFSSTVLSYNLTKYLPLAASHTIQLSPLFRWIGATTVLSFLVTGFLLFYLPAGVIITAAVLGVFTAAYAIPISEGKKNLRNIYGIKIGVISVVWAGVTVLLPVINQGVEFVNIPGVVYEAVQRVLFVGVLILPFDIRDYRSDDSSLGTLPQLLGVKESKILGFVLLCSCLILEGLHQSGMSASFLIFFVVAVITALMVRRSMLRQSPYFASFWVESIPIMWACLLALKNFF